MKLALYVSISFLSYHATVQLYYDWTQQCSVCSCILVRGKKTANCVNKHLYDIPNDLSHEINEIDFSFNSLGELRPYEITWANITNVEKLMFQNCSIVKIDLTAFDGLGLITELDLSRNDIIQLKGGLFKETQNLKIIDLSFNRLAQIEDGVFFNLTFLYRIFLNNNNIETITESAFQNLPALQHIDFSDNQFKTISIVLTDILPNLKRLDLQRNPWICDCHLQQFRENAINKSLIKTRTECAEPSHLKSLDWSDSNYFACNPHIIEPPVSAHVQATNEGVTLVCMVTGDPDPEVYWVRGEETLDFDPGESQQKYLIRRGRIGKFNILSNNLTIINVGYKDEGEYTCIARNEGGEDVKKIILTLALNRRHISSMLILALEAGLIVLFFIVILIFCFYIKNKNGLFKCPQKRLNTPVVSNSTEGRSVTDNLTNIDLFENEYEEPLLLPPEMRLKTESNNMIRVSFSDIIFPTHRGSFSQNNFSREPLPLIFDKIRPSSWSSHHNNNNRVDHDPTNGYLILEDISSPQLYESISNFETSKNNRAVSKIGQTQRVEPNGTEEMPPPIPPRP